jgi:hypothetical protein
MIADPGSIRARGRQTAFVGLHQSGDFRPAVIFPKAYSLSTDQMWTTSVNAAPLAEIRVGRAHLSTCSAVRVKVRHSLQLGEFRFGLIELA